MPIWWSQGKVWIHDLTSIHYLSTKNWSPSWESYFIWEKFNIFYNFLFKPFAFRDAIYCPANTKVDFFFYWKNRIIFAITEWPCWWNMNQKHIRIACISLLCFHISFLCYKDNNISPSLEYKHWLRSCLSRGHLF